MSGLEAFMSWPKPKPPTPRVTTDAGKVTIKTASIRWTGTNWAAVQSFAPDAIRTEVGAVFLPGKVAGYATWADPGDWIVRDALGVYAQAAEAFAAGTLAVS